MIEDPTVAVSGVGNNEASDGIPELIQNGTVWFADAKADAIKIYSSDLMYAPAAELTQLFSYCKANGIAIDVEAEMVTVAPGEVQTEGLCAPGDIELMVQRTLSLGGTISCIQMDEALTRAVIDDGRSLASVVQSVASNVAIVEAAFPKVQIEDIEPFPVSLSLLQTWFSAYQDATGKAFAAFIPDVAWDYAVFHQSWQSQLEALSSMLPNDDMQLGVIFNGDGSDLGNAAWSATAEQRIAEVESDPSISVNDAIIQTWVSYPSMTTPTNSVGSMVNIALEFSALYALYNDGSIGAHPVTSIAVGAPAEVSATAGVSTYVSGVVIALDAADIVMGTRVAVVLTDLVGDLSAEQTSGGTVSGSGTLTLVLNGTAAEVDAELSTLMVTGTGAMSDSIDMETFDANGRIDDRTIAVRFITASLSPSATLPSLALSPADIFNSNYSSISDTTSPTIIGSADPNAKITISIDGVSVGDIVADNKGSWSFQITSPLTDGPHIVDASALDQNNEASNTAGLSITIQSDGPPKPSVYVANDFAFVADAITDQVRPTLAGISAIGTSVYININGSPVGSATTSQSGTWVYLLPTSLAAGSYDISVSARDEGGNVSTASGIELEEQTPSQFNGIPASEPWFNYMAYMQYNPGAAITPGVDPLFDAAWYVMEYPSVLSSGMTPYQQFMTVGWKEGYDPDPYFNTDYYLNQNPDVAAAGINPLLHFELYGWKEGRNPSVLFSVSEYEQINPVPSAQLQDPLVMFLQAAQAGNVTSTPPPAVPVASSPDPLVDVTWYYAEYADVAASGVSAYTQFMSSGWQEGYNPDPWFDTGWYLATYKDAAASGINPLVFYEETGWKEGEDPSPQFSTDLYLKNNPDVAAAGMNPLLHYILYGQTEGRAIYQSTMVAISSPTIMLWEGSDSGFKGDGITNVTMPTFVGTGISRDIVEIQIDGSTVGVAEVDNSGYWSFTSTTPLPDGLQNVTAIQQSSNGTSSGVAVLEVNIDTITPAPPSLQLSPQTEAEHGTGDIADVSEPSFEGKAESGLSVTLTIDGVVSGTATVGSSGSWNYDVPQPLTGGPHIVSATATDVAGNISKETDLDITVWTLAAPTLLLSPQSDSGVAGDDVTNVVLPVLTGSAQAGTTLNLDIDGSYEAAVAVNGAGEWIYQATQALSQGPHTVTAVDTDASGDISAPTDLELMIETTPPPPPVLELSVGDFLPGGGDGLLDTGTPSFTGTAQPGSSVAVAIDGSASGITNVGSTGVWNYTVTTPLADGPHNVTAIATDSAGNSSAASDLAVTIKSLGTLTIQVAEDAYLGNAELTVSIDGQEVLGPDAVFALHNSGSWESDAGAWQDVTITGINNSEAHTVAVSFINDAYGGLPQLDRNLYIGGASYDGGSLSITPTSLYTNSTMTFLTSAAQAPAAAIKSVMTLYLSEDAYLGDAQFIASIDGTQINAAESVTTLHSSGQWEEFDFDGNWGTGQHTVSVAFTNDAYGGSPSKDRNLYVGSIGYDGNIYKENATLDTWGSQSITV